MLEPLRREELKAAPAVKASPKSSYPHRHLAAAARTGSLWPVAPSNGVCINGAHMEWIITPLLFFASFAALLILLVSAIAVSIWALCDLLRTVFGLPGALIGHRKRRLEQMRLRTDLNLLKRAGV